MDRRSFFKNSAMAFGAVLFLPYKARAIALENQVILGDTFFNGDILQIYDDWDLFITQEDIRCITRGKNDIKTVLSSIETRLVINKIMLDDEFLYKIYRERGKIDCVLFDKKSGYCYQGKFYVASVATEFFKGVSSLEMVGFDKITKSAIKSI